MVEIGQKVKFNEIEGYVVRIDINPLEEIDIASELRWGITYTVRVFRNFYKGGYADFKMEQYEFEVCE